MKSSKSSGEDEGTEAVPGQQNGDADSNDVVIGKLSSCVKAAFADKDIVFGFGRTENPIFFETI